MYLKRHHLDPGRDVKVVEVQQPFSVTALRSKRVDMAAIATPQYFIEKDKGGIRALFSNNDVIPEIQVILVFGRKNYFKAGEQTLKAFMVDCAKAARYCFNNPLEAARIMIKSKGLNVNGAGKVQDFTRDPAAPRASPYMGRRMSCRAFSS